MAWAGTCKPQQRYILAALSSLGCAVVFGMRSNLGIAIIPMVTPYNRTVIDETGNFTVIHKALFEWPAYVQGMLLSSFYWGFLVMQFPGGFVGSILPSNRVCGIAGIITAALHVLLPFALQVHYGLGIAVRILQGIAEGLFYPALHGIWRHWAPPQERSRLVTLTICGVYIGSVMGLFLTGILSTHFGWQFSFYIFGGMGVIWGIMWLLVTSEKPTSHPRISTEECKYIEDSLSDVDNSTAIKIKNSPWKAIFTSLPVYAIILANLSRNWTLVLYTVNQAKYLTDCFNFDVSMGGMLAAVPLATMTISVLLGGMIADALQLHTMMYTTEIRKLMNGVGFGLEAVFLLILGFVDSPEFAIPCLVLAATVSGFGLSGYGVNHLDIAPRYAAILKGLISGVGTIGSMFSPLVTSLIAQDPENAKEQWRIVFLIAAGVKLLCVLFYSLFASGDLQSWANPAGAEKFGVLRSLIKEMKEMSYQMLYF